MEREYCENCGAKDSLRPITKDDYLNVYGEEIKTIQEKFREEAIERKKQLKEKKYIFLAQIICGVLGLGLIILGFYNHISTSTLLNPTGITLIIVGIILLGFATKGGFCKECLAG